MSSGIQCIGRLAKNAKEIFSVDNNRKWIARVPFLSQELMALGQFKRRSTKRLAPSESYRERTQPQPRAPLRASVEQSSRRPSRTGDFRADEGTTGLEQSIRNSETSIL